MPSLFAAWRTAARGIIREARYRLPAIYAEREFVEAGGIMRYGFIKSEFFRQAAIYARRQSR